MTNGEKLLKVFPNMEINEKMHKGIQIDFDSDWWNAEYKESTTQERQAESDKFDASFQDGYNNGYAQSRFDYEQESTTKNDLGVDCISRADARHLIAESFRKNLLGMTFNKMFKTLYEGVDNLPSVTPQPRKGHWRPIYQGDEIIDYRCSECEFGNTFGKGTIGMNFCPYCGADMREVKE